MYAPEVILTHQNPLPVSELNSLYGWEMMAVVISIYFIIAPLVVGHYAATHGRRFWVWWGLAIIIPVLSVFILVLLPDTSPQGFMARRRRILLRKKLHATIPEQIMLEVDFILKYHTPNREPQEPTEV